MTTNQGIQRREGTATERPPGSGRWLLRAWDPVAKRQRSKTVVSTTAKGVAKELRLFVAEVEESAGVLPSKGLPTFREMVAIWEIDSDRDDELSSTTLARVQVELRTYLSSIADLRIDKITREGLETVYDRLKKNGGRCPAGCPLRPGKHAYPCPNGKPLAAATVRRSHNTVRGVLNVAVKRGKLSKNPALFKVAIPEDQVFEIVPPTDEEVVRLLVAAEKTDWQLFVDLNFAAVMGARRGEQCGLRWAHLDLEAGEVTISRAVSHGVDKGAALVDKRTKQKTHRTLGLDAEMVRIFRSHRKWCLERAMAAGVRVGPRAYVFSNAFDCSVSWRPDYVTLAFARLRAKVGLEHVRLHDLRHYMITAMMEEGVDVRTIMGRAGHASLASATKYSHFSHARDQAAAEGLRARLDRRASGS